MWESGKFEIDGLIFTYEAKVYAWGSELGINGGRVSKLVIVRGDVIWDFNNTIVQYERGWVIEPKDDISKKALEHVLKLYEVEASECC